MYKSIPANFEDLVEPIDDSSEKTAYWLRSLIRENVVNLDENINGGLKVALALFALKENKNNVV